MLASPRPRKKYSGDWKGATHRDEDGLLSWCLGGDLLYPDAFIIVMNVIHGRNRTVPRVLESLAEIAVVTDYLPCHEFMEIVSVLWMNGLLV